MAQVVKIRVPYTNRAFAGRNIEITDRSADPVVLVEMDAIASSTLDHKPDLIRDGYTVKEHETSVKCLLTTPAHDMAGVLETYKSEIEELVKESVPNCQSVVVFDVDMRMSPSTQKTELCQYTSITFLRPKCPLGLVINGNKVKSVAEEGFAYSQGIREGMCIVSVNNVSVDMQNSMTKLISAIAVGCPVDLVTATGFLGLSGRGLRDPAGAVHSDCSPYLEARSNDDCITPPCCLRHTHLPSDNHFLIVNAWRSVDFESPVGRDPLALLDMSTVTKHDMISAVGGGAHFFRLAHSDKHKWHIVEDITASQVILHKQYSTCENDLTQRQIFHSGVTFVNQSPEAPPRVSVEARCLVVLRRNDGDEMEPSQERIDRFCRELQPFYEDS